MAAKSLSHPDAGGQAAIDLVIGAGAEGSLARAQKSDQLGHLLRLADAAERMGRAEALIGGLDVGITAALAARRPFQDRRADRAGADGVHADALARIIERQRARQ